MSDPKRASGVTPKTVEWLWEERIPRGALTLIAGKPDVGKGLFAARVAADVSSAGGTVLYSAMEDDAGMMTRPRLEAAGADLDNVLLWRFQLPENQYELESIIIDRKVDLVIMDPMAAHLSGGISRHSDNVRTVLNPLTGLIELTGTSVLMVEHTLKRVARDSHPLSAIGGSGSGLPAASRMAFVFGVDPDDAERRVLASAKSNLRDRPRAMAFYSDIEELAVVGEVPYIEYEDEIDFDPSRLVVTRVESSSTPGRRPDKRAQAAEWLTTYLAWAGEPVAAGTVMEDAKQHALAAKTVRRAADDMGIVKDPPGGGRNCTWDLPDDVKKLLGMDSDPDPDDGTHGSDEAERDSDEIPGQMDVDDVIADILSEGGGDNGN